jgi:hypothetical protein
MSLQTPIVSGQLLLLAAHPPRIISVSLSDLSFKLLVADCGGTPQGIAFDEKHRHVFWTNMGEDQSRNDGFIERINLDGSNRREIVHRGKTFTPMQVVTDPQQGYLYWAEREGMRVMRSRLDGRDITALVQTGETEDHRTDERRHCIGVAVDRTNGHIYWAQKGLPHDSNGCILRAGLDLPAGADPKNRSDLNVILAKLPEPIELGWDSRENFLYWTDRGDHPPSNTLNRARYFCGRLVEPEILLSGLNKNIRLALDVPHGRAFVSDLGGSVRTMKPERPGESDVIFSGQGPLAGIVYVPTA